MHDAAGANRLYWPASDFTIASRLTVSLWFTADSPSTDYRRLFQIIDGATAPGNGVMVTIEGSKLVVMGGYQTADWNGIAGQGVVSPNDLPIYRPHHLVFSVDTTANFKKMIGAWLDGRAIRNTTGTLFNSGNPVGRIYVGARSDDSQVWLGKIGEVAIWEHWLPGSAEIEALRRGRCAAEIAPGAQRFYAPLFASSRAERGLAAATGTFTASRHVPVLRGRPRLVRAASSGTTIVVGLATGTAAALASGIAQTRTSGLATESDTALAAGLAQTRTTGIATGTDVALAAGIAQTRTTGLATESDMALASGLAQTRTTGLATGTDVALPMTQGQMVVTGLATGTDTALAAGLAQTRTTGIAPETDTALAAGLAQTRTTGIAPETDTAFTAGIAQTRTTGIAPETDAAIAAGIAQTRTTSLATGTDTVPVPTILAVVPSSVADRFRAPPRPTSWVSPARPFAYAAPAAPSSFAAVARRRAWHAPSRPTAWAA